MAEPVTLRRHLYVQKLRERYPGLEGAQDEDLLDLDEKINGRLSARGIRLEVRPEYTAPTGLNAPVEFVKGITAGTRGLVSTAAGAGIEFGAEAVQGGKIQALEGMESELTRRRDALNWKKTQLEPLQELTFQYWYKDVVEELTARGVPLNNNPDDPEHYYDYRGAFKADMGPDETAHWPSRFKHPDHPNRFVTDENGVVMDTMLGIPKDGTGFDLNAFLNTRRDGAPEEDIGPHEKARQISHSPFTQPVHRSMNTLRDLDPTQIPTDDLERLSTRFDAETVNTRTAAAFGRELKKEVDKQTSEGWAKPTPGLEDAPLLSWHGIPKVARIIGEATPSTVAAGAVAVSTGNPGLGALILAGQQGLDAYSTSRGREIPVDQAQRLAGVETVMSFYIERLPLKKLTKGVRGNAFSRYIKQGNIEGTEEVLDVFKSNVLDVYMGQGLSHDEALAKMAKDVAQMRNIPERGFVRTMKDIDLFAGGGTGFIGGHGAGGMSGALMGGGDLDASQRKELKRYAEEAARIATEGGKPDGVQEEEGDDGGDGSGSGPSGGGAAPATPGTAEGIDDQSAGDQGPGPKGPVSKADKATRAIQEAIEGDGPAVINTARQDQEANTLLQNAGLTLVLDEDIAQIREILDKDPENQSKLTRTLDKIKATREGSLGSVTMKDGTVHKGRISDSSLDDKLAIMLEDGDELKIVHKANVRTHRVGKDPETDEKPRTVKETFERIHKEMGLPPPVIEEEVEGSDAYADLEGEVDEGDAEAEKAAIKAEQGKIIEDAIGASTIIAGVANQQYGTENMPGLAKRFDGDDKDIAWLKDHAEKDADLAARLRKQAEEFTDKGAKDAAKKAMQGAQEAADRASKITEFLDEVELLRAGKPSTAQSIVDTGSVPAKTAREETLARADAYENVIDEMDEKTRVKYQAAADSLAGAVDRMTDEEWAKVDEARRGNVDAGFLNNEKVVDADGNRLSALATDGSVDVVADESKGEKNEIYSREEVIERLREVYTDPKVVAEEWANDPEFMSPPVTYPVMLLEQVLGKERTQELLEGGAVKTVTDAEVDEGGIDPEIEEALVGEDEEAAEPGTANPTDFGLPESTDQETFQDVFTQLGGLTDDQLILMTAKDIGSEFDNLNDLGAGMTLKRGERTAAHKAMKIREWFDANTPETATRVQWETGKFTKAQRTALDSVLKPNAESFDNLPWSRSEYTKGDEFLFMPTAELNKIIDLVHRSKDIKMPVKTPLLKKLRMMRDRAEAAGRDIGMKTVKKIVADVMGEEDEDPPESKATGTYKSRAARDIEAAEAHEAKHPTDVRAIPKRLKRLVPQLPEAARERAIEAMAVVRVLTRITPQQFEKLEGVGHDRLGAAVNSWHDSVRTFVDSWNLGEAHYTGRASDEDIRKRKILPKGMVQALKDELGETEYTRLYDESLEELAYLREKPARKKDLELGVTRDTREKSVQESEAEVEAEDLAAEQEISTPKQIRAAIPELHPGGQKRAVEAFLQINMIANMTAKEFGKVMDVSEKNAQQAQLKFVENEYKKLGKWLHAHLTDKKRKHVQTWSDPMYTTSGYKFLLKPMISELGLSRVKEILKESKESLGDLTKPKKAAPKKEKPKKPKSVITDALQVGSEIEDFGEVEFDPANDDLGRLSGTIKGQMTGAGKGEPIVGWRNLQGDLSEERTIFLGQDAKDVSEKLGLPIDTFRVEKHGSVPSISFNNEEWSREGGIAARLTRVFNVGLATAKKPTAKAAPKPAPTPESDESPVDALNNDPELMAKVQAFSERIQTGSLPKGWNANQVTNLPRLLNAVAGGVTSFKINQKNLLKKAIKHVQDQVAEEPVKREAAETTLRGDHLPATILGDKSLGGTGSAAVSKKSTVPNPTFYKADAMRKLAKKEGAEDPDKIYKKLDDDSAVVVSAHPNKTRFTRASVSNPLDFFNQWIKETPEFSENPVFVVTKREKGLVLTWTGKKTGKKKTAAQLALNPEIMGFTQEELVEGDRVRLDVKSVTEARAMRSDVRKAVKAEFAGKEQELSDLVRERANESVGVEKDLGERSPYQLPVSELVDIIVMDRIRQSAKNFKSATDRFLDEEIPKKVKRDKKAGEAGFIGPLKAPPPANPTSPVAKTLEAGRQTPDLLPERVMASLRHMWGAVDKGFVHILPNARHRFQQLVDDFRTQFLPMKRRMFERISYFRWLVFSDVEKRYGIRGVRHTMDLLYTRSLLGTVRSGLDVANGLTETELQDHLTFLETTAKPEVLEAAKLLRTLLDSLAEDLVARGVLKQEDLKTDYAPHVVIDYIPEFFLTKQGSFSVMQRTFGEPFRGYSRKRIGSKRLIETSETTLWRHIAKVLTDNAYEDWALSQAAKYDGKAEWRKQYVEEKLAAGIPRDQIKVPQAPPPQWIDKDERKWRRLVWSRKGFKAIAINTEFKANTESVVADPALQSWEEVFDELSATDPDGDQVAGVYRDSFTVAEWLSSRGQRGGKPIREVFAKGNNVVFLLPQEVAEAMQDLVEFSSVFWDMVYVVNRLTRSWKSITLTSAGLPYQIRNLMGDAANLAQFDPAAVEYIPLAMKVAHNIVYTKRDAIRLKSAYETKVYNVAKQKDVAFSGFTAEIQHSAISDRVVEKWHQANEFREAFLRIAILAHQLDRVQKNLPVQRLASIDLTGLDPESAAAKVARETLVDYVSVPRLYRRLLSSYASPFIRFYEANARNHMRHGVKAPLKYWTPVFTVYALATLLNNYDEERRDEEWQLPRWIRDGLHFNLWPSEKLRQFWVWAPEFPVDSAWGFVGLDKTVRIFTDLVNDKKTPRESAKEFLTGILHIPRDKIAPLTGPIMQFLSGIKTNQDPFSKREVMPPELFKVWNNNMFDGFALGAGKYLSGYMLEKMLTPAAQLTRSQRKMDLSGHPAPVGPIMDFLKYGPLDWKRALGLYEVSLDQQAQSDLMTEGQLGRAKQEKHRRHAWKLAEHYGEESYDMLFNYVTELGEDSEWTVNLFDSAKTWVRSAGYYQMVAKFEYNDARNRGDTKQAKYWEKEYRQAEIDRKLESNKRTPKSYRPEIPEKFRR